MKSLSKSDRSLNSINAVLKLSDRPPNSINGVLNWSDHLFSRLSFARHYG
ncbi:MAG: hypothetical protein HEQ20_21660 [Aphanizomenon flos-aquae KM1D3_PB]|nr:hypothetical protein [Aphanizomenon flos-aquae]QSV72879.1 MAG: hypothetical protein HEQ20_21660 [Aphanizomenon flos-aquae KM1D3_PB]